MGRRSDFTRRDKDFYPTIDPKAVIPLLPHLPAGARYAEPCAGEGHLIEMLAGHAQLAWACDVQVSAHPLVHENDALKVGRGDAEMFITNPPWSRAILHPLIVHLSDLAPTWLLFDSNWANTIQAGPYLARCRRIVSVGRLIWIEGSKVSGKEDVSWYLFDRPRVDLPPAFYGRRCYPPRPTRRAPRVCSDCGILIDRFGKWRLEPRNGIPTPVHKDCLHPSGAPGEPGETPLLDWRPNGEPCP